MFRALPVSCSMASSTMVARELLALALVCVVAALCVPLAHCFFLLTPLLRMTLFHTVIAHEGLTIEFRNLCITSLARYVDAVWEVILYECEYECKRLL